MNPRQQNLLKIITTEFIRTAQPVSSKYIAEAGEFDLSGATIRNEMVDLEKQGYISHPHTSAGRVPTELGYQYFVENFLVDENLSKSQQQALEKIMFDVQSFEPAAIKSLAKQVAEFSDSAVFVAFANNDFYYTGLSNLFSQPEFIEHQLVHRLSSVIDHLDKSIMKIFNQVPMDVKIAVGSKNPFSEDCSSIMTKYQSAGQPGIVGILGPLRMDYQNNVNLIKFLQNLINKLK